MSTPPFKLSTGGNAVLGTAITAEARGAPADLCCDHDLAQESPRDTPRPALNRAKLHQLDPHLHCSVIGTCLGTGELRKLMLKHGATRIMSDLEVHHHSVSLAMDGGEAAKAIHKALDQKHAGAIRTFSQATDVATLESAWRNAWQQGDIPGAYWALLTHKLITPELRQLAFGEIHMLSHLMGSANRTELKRFVALEKENAELRERLDREHARHEETLQERDQFAAQMHRQALDYESRIAQAQAQIQKVGEEDLQSAVPELVAIQTERRERAERSAQDALQEMQRLHERLARMEQKAREFAEELAMAEDELQRLSADPAEANTMASRQLLEGRVVLYVGGRPSSTPAIRDFVKRHGGDFLYPDGGLEVRKGMLAAQLPRASMVVFPVDCVDHDSVANLKRLCERHNVPFMPLRTASLASFAAAVQREMAAPMVERTSRFCLRHG